MDKSRRNDDDDDDDEGEEQKYCICRSTDISRFMIGCEACEEWYHGDCINVTEDQAQYIKHWYCQKCRVRFPSLKITYHKKRVAVEPIELSEPKKKQDSTPAPSGHSSDKHSSKSALSSSKHDHHKKHDKHDKHKIKHKSSSSHHREKDTADREKHDESRETKKSSRECGRCKGCSRVEDCGRCEYCKDMKKFGGKNLLRHKCKFRQCQEYGVSKEDRSDQQSHSKREGSASTSHQESKHSHSEHKEKLSANSSSSKHREMGSGSSSTTKLQQQQHMAPVKSTSTLSTLSAASNELLSSSSLEVSVESRKDIHSAVKDKPYHTSSTTKVSPQTDDATGARKQSKSKPNISDCDSYYQPQINQISGAQFYNALASSEYRQCFGPGCVQVARRNSKYCSDDCGLNLATNRIFEILPQRIQQWQGSRCIAEENNKKTLEEIRHKQCMASDKLMELESRRQQLEAVIARGKQATVLPETENADTEDDASELNMFCVTCGMEVPQRIALRHMEKCFNKIESQTSFGSMYKTRIEGESMFCDFYSASQRTYCKRLKILCPEHVKEPKISADEVCGCPLVQNVFEELGEVCRMSKRKCVRHHCWEKLRRAQLDMERVRQWMLLDELFEQERHIRTQIASRAGVLSLMLHQTIDHSAPSQISPTQIVLQQ